MHDQESFNSSPMTIDLNIPMPSPEDIATEIQNLAGDNSFVFVMNMSDGEMLLTAWQTDRAYVDIVADLGRLYGEPDGNASVPAAFVFSAIAPVMLMSGDEFKTNGGFKLHGPGEPDAS